MTRITVAALITEPPPSGLGYCCVWKFFGLYARTSLIAARLGIAPRTIRIHKALCRDGEYVCEKKLNCMRRKV